MYDAFWAHRITYKRAINMYHCQLVYEINCTMPIPLELSIIDLQKYVDDRFQSSLEK